MSKDIEVLTVIEAWGWCVAQGDRDLGEMGQS